MARAQLSGAKAAVLVFAIMGLIVLYILFLPPAARRELLEGPPAPNITVPVPENVSLLLERPGRLEPIGALEIEKAIPNLRLQIVTQAVVLSSLASATPSASWISKKRATLNFTIADLAHTSNAILSFNIGARSGRLIVRLNDIEILDRELDEANIALPIPQEALRDRNVLVFELSRPLAPWRVNRYELSSISFVADVTDVSGQASISRFILSRSESANLESASLRFFVDWPCAALADFDKLYVRINGHEVYGTLPPCGGDIVNQPFSPDILVAGENMIEFNTTFRRPTTGTYAIEQILIKLNLKAALPPLYYFDLTPGQFGDITAGLRKVQLRVLFADGVTRKQAELVINGRSVGLDTTEFEWAKDISDYAKLGSNAIKIVPKVAIDITEIEVRLA